MTRVRENAAGLRAIADRLASAAEESRPTFTDATRADFDHRVIDEVRRSIGELAARVDELDVALDAALRGLG